MSLLSNQRIQNQPTDKKPNPIIWFFFAILIPVIVAIIITIVVLSIAGFDVGSWAKETGSKIPGISSFVKTDEEKEAEQLTKNHSLKLQEKDDQIAELEDEVDDHLHTIDTLKDDILKLQQQLESNEEISSSELEIDEEQTNTVKEMASSYRKMDPKQAAVIIETMDRSMALDILHEVSNDVRGKIIEEMTTDKAVEITEAFIKRSE